MKLSKGYSAPECAFAIELNLYNHNTKAEMYARGVMKILGICASHRKGRGTYRLLEEEMKGAKEKDHTIDTGIIELAYAY